jgi:hypothetical protein
VVPFTDQDGRIPTYPPANLTTPGDPVTAMRAAFTNNGAPACVPGLTYDSTHAAGLDTDTPGPEPTRPSVESILDHPESLLHDPDSVLHDPESLLHNPESSLNGSSVPTASQVLFDHTGPARFSPDGGPQLPQAAHSHTLDTGLPADPAATHSGTDSPVAAPSGAPHGPGFDQPQPQHDQPHVEQTGYDLPRHDHLSPDQPITPAADGTTPSATGWHPGRDSLVVPPDPGSSTGTTPPTGGPVPADPTGSGTPDAGRAAGPGLTPIPQDAPRLGSAVPGMVPQPSMPGPSLGTPPPIPVAPIPPVPSAPSMPPPLSGTPPPLPNAPLPTAPSPIPSTPIPSTPIPSTPIPSTPFPAPNLGSPAPGAPAPTPGPSPQPPSNPPAPNSPAPKPISNLPGAPATTVSHPGAAPGTPSALPPDVLAEPAAAAVTGAAVVEAGDEPHHHDDPRLPRLRVRYEGDRDRLRKQVDLKQDSDSADMARTGEHVQPTIGE